MSILNIIECNLQWTGLLVEPNQWFNKKMEMTNRNAWSFNYCLSTKPHPEVVTFDHAGSAGGGIINEGKKK